MKRWCECVFVFFPPRNMSQPKFRFTVYPRDSPFNETRGIISIVEEGKKEPRVLYDCKYLIKSDQSKIVLFLDGIVEIITSDTMISSLDHDFASNAYVFWHGQNDGFVCISKQNTGQVWVLDRNYDFMTSFKCDDIDEFASRFRISRNAFKQIEIPRKIKCLRV